MIKPAVLDGLSPQEAGALATSRDALRAELQRVEAELARKQAGSNEYVFPGISLQEFLRYKLLLFRVLSNFY